MRAQFPGLCHVGIGHGPHDEKGNPHRGNLAATALGNEGMAELMQDLDGNQRTSVSKQTLQAERINQRPIKMLVK